VSEDVAARVREVLDAQGAAYELVEIDPQHADTAAFCEVYGFAPEASANTIVVASKRGERRHVACVLLATTRLDVNGAVRRESGFSKASFADAEETVALTGMQIGGVTPFGLPGDLPLLVDAAVLGPDRVIVGGGDRATKLLVDPAALAALPQARVVEGLAR
jgi:prolyl-tRNA editing enzyme YbaK/EbsC (Cys-tRNA(Pro) deacylase)